MSATRCPECNDLGRSPMCPECCLNEPEAATARALKSEGRTQLVSYACAHRLVEKVTDARKMDLEQLRRTVDLHRQAAHRERKNGECLVIDDREVSDIERMVFTATFAARVEDTLASQRPDDVAKDIREERARRAFRHAENAVRWYRVAKVL